MVNHRRAKSGPSTGPKDKQSKTSVYSLSTPLEHLLYYSLAAISQAVTPAWETTLEGTTSKVDNSAMHPWVAILGFLLLLADGVTSYREVIGVVGQSVTLPCFYEGKVTSMCWGQGKCSWIDCRNTIISTDGYKITEQKNERYKLKGDIGKRDVSLTIENAVPSDSGLYCCRIQKWLFNDKQSIIKLTIKPAPPMTTVSPYITSESTSTSTTNIPRTTYTTPPTMNTTIPEGNSTTTVVMDTHMTTGASTSALPKPTPTDDVKPVPKVSHILL
uniref:Ig-like domain-containing protein n=1 Tax=Bos indicus x Bos taurus TaxID=30522 RepID=A0A4W2ICM2_BOBOX